MRTGRGILVFDDGWHKLATALWLFGPDQRGAGLGGRAPRSCPTIEIDAPSTIVWEHDNGIRGVWDITLAPAMYLRSDYYTNDERWEVTGQRGYARVNRCTGRGIQQPSLEVYADGEMRSYHALDDDWASSFRDSGRHWLRWLHTGDGSTPLERRRSRRRSPVRPGRLRQQRGRRRRGRSRIARLAARPGERARDLTIRRMDHLGIIVDDLEAAVAFSVELGMELEGEPPVKERRVGTGTSDGEPPARSDA